MGRSAAGFIPPLLGWAAPARARRRRAARRLVLRRGRRFGRQALRHPVLISSPVALLALGAGIGAQALLRPLPSQRADLLDALIATPVPPASAPSSGGVGSGPAAPPQPSAPALPAEVQAHRAEAASEGGALALPEDGPVLDLEIRVALLKLAAHPRLSARSGWHLRDRNGRLLQSGGAGQTADLPGLLASHSELWLEPAGGEPLLADGRPFVGRFRILRSSNGILVVNHLPLEQYISSVVGGEMPTHWNAEALRAQAVAARSYAMAHMARPADPHWHLGDTTRWQNYTGLAAVTTSTREATRSTAGMILSYQGGIVESLYAATHQISREAHGHLGASMSQHGAQDLAQQGLRFNEILGRYYPGASLARLESGPG